MSDIPEDLHFSADHLWVAPVDDSLLRVGITEFAQQSLGDVTDVNPPKAGTSITAGEPCCEIESTKSLVDLISPISGTVNERNEEVVLSPDLVNSSPYGDGWLFVVRIDPMTKVDQLSALMDATAYRSLTDA